MTMLYTHSIGNQLQNTMVVFKMRDSVPSARYSPVCNVLRQWKTSLIPTYRVYRLYDILVCVYYTHTNIFLEQEKIEQTFFSPSLVVFLFFGTFAFSM